jgi:hypothetical protein
VTSSCDIHYYKHLRRGKSVQMQEQANVAEREGTKGNPPTQDQSVLHSKLVVTAGLPYCTFGILTLY